MTTKARLSAFTEMWTQKYEYLNVNNYASDPTYSPEGKTSITVILNGDTYDFWKKAKEEKTYEDEKQKLAYILRGSV